MGIFAVPLALAIAASGAFVTEIVPAVVDASVTSACGQVLPLVGLRLRKAGQEPISTLEVKREWQVVACWACQSYFRPYRAASLSRQTHPQAAHV